MESIKIIILDEGIAIPCDALDRKFLDIHNIPNVRKIIISSHCEALETIEVFAIPEIFVLLFLKTIKANGFDITINQK